MLKRILSWKYLIAVVIVLGGCIYVSRQDQKTRDQYEQNCNQLNASALPPSGHYEDCDKGAENAARHLPRWYRVFGWPDGITTWAILLTLVAIAEQTSQTRRAADATADSANAAYGSVMFAEAQFELMKEERRARISINARGIQVEDPDSEYWNLMTSIEIRNLGQTRAFIKKTGGEFVIRADGEERPKNDDLSSLYLSEEYVDPSTAPVVVALHQFNLEPASLKELGDDLHSRKRMIHLYGFIEYETLGMKFTEEFKYFWMAGNFMRGMFSGEERNPTDVEKVEEGYWWDNRPRPEDDEQTANWDTTQL
jgi:hypothetical protein